MTDYAMGKSMLRNSARLLLGALLAVGVAHANEGGGLTPANTQIGNVASVQTGAKLFFNYCSGCHSLQYMRYSRIGEDLKLDEKQVMENFVFTGAKFGDLIHSNMPADDAAKWFGTAPPDLTLEARAKGPDWIYSYLRSFYLDPTRPLGWNNTLFPNASMPNVLWELQGLQVAKVGEHGENAPLLELKQPGSLTPQKFDQAARDITAFLHYVSEPAALQRQAMGAWVLLYLVLFTLLAYLLKQEYWKDVH